MSSGNSISNAQSSTTATFVTALVFNAAVFGIELAAFTAVRPYFPAIYQPRTYIPPESRRSKPLGQQFYIWPWSLYKADYRDIQVQNGPDAYFFVRFLRMMVRILLPVWLISWAVLLPLTAVGTSATGLNRFNFGSISVDNQTRYAAHLILAWIFTIWIWYNLRQEMSHFVTTRQRWLMDPAQASSAQANTILVTGVPQRYLSEAALRTLFSYLPGGVRQVWVNRDLKEMPDLHDRRMAACNQLESAETSLLNTAAKLRNKKLKKEAKTAKKAGKKSLDSTTDVRPLTRESIPDTERGDVALAEKLVPRGKRPTHRLPLLSFLPSLPLVGKQVDSIDWAREEIVTTSAALRECRRTLAKDVARTSAAPVPDDDEGNSVKPDQSQTYPPLNSAFILFNQQVAAHLAAQTLTHHGPYRMAFKSIGVAPDDVIWGNLNMNPYEMKIRVAISWAATIGLIILWAFPVAFIGAVSNIHSLCATYSWLSWLCSLPPVVVGIITGILPPVLLAVLMMLLPIILRLMSRFEGVPQRTGIELSLMHRFFLFLVIHSFLIVTISSGIIAALPGLVKNPSSVPTLLAQNLPKASTFFLTYIILQGLSGTASGFLQIVALVIYYLKLFILGSTPRSIYRNKYTLRSVNWGTLFPSTTLLVVITLSYSIISPIINGLAFATFVLFFFLYKYLFLYQYEQPRASETGGLFFPIAIQHVFVGLYLQQICLAALFFLAQDANKKPSAIPEGALMVVLIVFTAFFHLVMNNSFGPLIKYLPLTLADHAIPVPDENRAAAGRQLDDQGSVQSVNPEKQRLRDGSIDTAPCEDANAKRAETVEEAERGAPCGSRDVDGGVDSIKGVDEEEGPKDFYHPASVDPQRVIWIPHDALGLAFVEEEAMRQRGILVSSRNAEMDAEGNVDIQGPPPDELEAE
ncbi:DUF221-domain-containing protein [Sparassis latifolia]